MAAIVSRIMALVSPTHGPILKDLAGGWRPVVQPVNTIMVLYNRLDKLMRPYFGKVHTERAATHIAVQDAHLWDISDHVYIISNSSTLSLIVKTMEGRRDASLTVSRSELSRCKIRLLWPFPLVFARF